MAKRSNGEGSVRRRGNGTWSGELMDGYTNDGKKKIVYFSGKTKGEVLQKMKEYQRLVENEDVHIDKDLLFCNWADSWYEDYKSEVQPSTYASYQYTLKILKEYFSGIKLVDIRLLHINRFQDFLQKKPYSVSQISKCRAMLIQIFDAAINNDVLSRNPARSAKKLKLQTDAYKMRNKDSFTDEEVEILMAQLRHDLLGHSIRFLLGTGIRVQELLALNEDDISPDGSSVQISHAIKMVNGIPTLGPPKSKCGVRVVPIPEDFRDSAFFLRKEGRHTLIWTGNEGNYYSVGTFRRRFYHALREIGGVRPLSPHCCRHTYVTRLNARGVPLDRIARLVGHSDIGTTMGYDHIRLDTLTEAVKVLNSHH